jgi:hypothetical protein
LPKLALVTAWICITAFVATPYSLMKKNASDDDDNDDAEAKVSFN